MAKDALARPDAPTAAVQTAHHQARVLAARTPGARIWVVRMHLHAAEAAGWRRPWRAPWSYAATPTASCWLRRQPEPGPLGTV